ncbi:hypothetical protein DWF00_02720 [Bosea caraganae]|nr:hypothetical protein DWF00_02720 [Bosea caraganae]
MGLVGVSAAVAATVTVNETAQAFELPDLKGALPDTAAVRAGAVAAPVEAVAGRAGVAGAAAGAGAGAAAGSVTADAASASEASSSPHWALRKSFHF